MKSPKLPYLFLIVFCIALACVSTSEVSWLPDRSLSVSCEGHFQAVKGGVTVTACQFENHRSEPLMLRLSGFQISSEPSTLKEVKPKTNALPAYLIGAAASQQSKEGILFSGVIALGLMLADTLDKDSEDSHRMEGLELKIDEGDKKRLSFLLRHPQSLVERTLNLCFKKPNEVCIPVRMQKAVEETRRRPQPEL